MKKRKLTLRSQVIFVLSDFTIIRGGAAPNTVNETTTCKCSISICEPCPGE